MNYELRIICTFASNLRVVFTDKWRMKQFWVGFSVLVLLFSACQSNKTGNSEVEEPADSVQKADTVSSSLQEEIGEETSVPKAADELFDDFIFNFAANRTLQSSRIKFPLLVKRGDEVSYVKKGDWQMEYFFMKQDFYTLLFDSEKEMEAMKETNIEHAVVEKIYLHSKTVKQYVFDRVNGLWTLQQIIHMPLSESRNASFLEFYEKFASSIEYQSDHLMESVKFIGPDPDDDFNQMEGVITPDTWEAFAPELPSGMIYNIVYGAPKKETGRKIFVLRGIANGMEMELTFKHEGGKWKLEKLVT